MDRNSLLENLKRYQTGYVEEQRYIKRFIDLIEGYDNCFERSLLTGHITGSAWVINSSFDKVLLILHRKLDRWLQPGGHADGNEDVLAVAKKELVEETGISADAVNEMIYDIDIHLIPQKKGVPEHFHYDVRFLFQVDDTIALHPNEELKAIRWCTLDEITGLVGDEKSILRMAEKTRVMAKSKRDV